MQTTPLDLCKKWGSGQLIQKYEEVEGRTKFQDGRKKD